KSFRIKGMEDWNVRGFYGKRMPQYLEEDFFIKTLLRKALTEASVSNIEIEHSANRVNIIIETARPGLIIGRGGEGVETLKKLIVKKLQGKKFATISLLPDEVKKSVSPLINRDIKIDIREVKNPWISAALVSQWVA